MSPTEPSAAMRDQTSEQLPRGKSLVDVFADFIRFLFDSTKELFMTSESNGELRWKSVSDNIELVLTHPNGWGGLQQTQLRDAAVRAGIVPDTPSGRSRVHFVTEGEASFNFCATHTEAGKHLRVRHTLSTGSQPSDTPTVRRRSFDHRRRRWNHRHQHLYSSRQQSVTGRRAL